MPHADPGTINPAGPPRPRFNNRHESFELIDVGGQVRIAYRRPNGQPYPPRVLEAAAIIRDHPCRQIPRLYDVSPAVITAEYLDDFMPVGKAGLTTTQRYRRWFGRAGREGRFSRRVLRDTLRSVRNHFDHFVEQFESLGRYMKQHGLWHDDVIPQNVMWRASDASMRLVDIGAFCPRACIDSGERLPHGRRRTRGVYRLDYTVDVDYIREVFLQDLDPWYIVLLRKFSVGTRQ